jgi:hypothetical protein
MSLLSITEAQEQNGDTTPATANNDTSVALSAIKSPGYDVKNTATLILVVSAGISILCIVIIIGYIIFTRLKPKRTNKKNRERKDSDRNFLYQNLNRNRTLTIGDSVETLENRPLPQLPVQTEHMIDTSAEDYMVPTPLSWRDRQREEIENLPPAPPVYPEQLANLPHDGEGAYTTLISDDASSLLPPRTLHEISSDEQLPETSEENGYIAPRRFRQGSEYRSPVVEETSITITVQNRAISSNSEKPTIFRSTLQIQLSPPIQPRRPPVPTSKPTDEDERMKS